MTSRLPHPVRRIAILRALALGDLLCATPAFRALRRRFPDAEITLIALPWAEELVRRLDSLDRFRPFPGWPGIREAPYDAARTAAFLVEAKAERYDLALQLHGSGPASNGFVAALGARRTLGFTEEHDERLSIGLPWRDEEHEIGRWLRLVAITGAAPNGTRLEFPVLPAEERAVEVVLREAPFGSGPLVGLHPGASDADKRWPPERFAALGDRLAGAFGARLLLTGSAAEAPLTRAVRSAMTAPALDLAGRTDLGRLAAVLRRLDLLVTNDTGVSHLAVATATPSVVLFGPTPVRRWAPLDRSRHRVVAAPAVVPEAADGAEALRRLPVEAVLAAAAGLLQEPAAWTVESPNRRRHGGDDAGDVGDAGDAGVAPTGTGRVAVLSRG